MTPARQLADLIVRAAKRGTDARSPETAREAARLVAQLGADPDEHAVDDFFEALAAGLRAEGATLPPLTELPPTVAPLIAAAGNVLAAGPGADYEALAEHLDRSFIATTGTSPRLERERRLEQEIRERVAASVADSMRQHGLTPASDYEDDD